MIDTHPKALLYAIPLFLTPFADKVVPILFENKWPSGQSLIACTLLGVIATAIGLRAYYDGSYERAKQNGTKPPAPIPPPK